MDFKKVGSVASREMHLNKGHKLKPCPTNIWVGSLVVRIAPFRGLTDVRFIPDPQFVEVRVLDENSVRIDK